MGVVLLKKIFIITLLTLSFTAIAAPPKKSKFYDFGDQVIDGEIKKPVGDYIIDRRGAEFDRLTSLKKSFLPTDIPPIEITMSLKLEIFSIVFLIS